MRLKFASRNSREEVKRTIMPRSKIIYGKDAPPVGRPPALVLVNPKYPHNVGRAVRNASCYGINQVWYTGDRVSLEPENGERLPREERMKGYQDVELYQYDYPFDVFNDAVPVAVEVRENAIPLSQFWHPPNCVYVFGPEDGSLGPGVVELCHFFIIIESRHCLNLADATATILYHRALTRYRNAGEPMPTLNEDRGFIEPKLA